MKEFNVNKQNERQKMEAKLQLKLAERKQQREESAKESQVAFQSIKAQQEEMVHKVLQNQADLTEEAAARIMEEHKRNMETINSQLSISKIRQEKQLEERLAQRKARLAEKEQERQKAGAAMAEKLQRELEEEKQKIRKDHERELESLKNNLQEETQQALNAQELQISQMIGQLEVGQARRKNILQKQDKLISELENQLANKVGSHKQAPTFGENPKGYTTTTELMQKHYGQVETLNSSLQATRERQEQALQEKLEQKRLIRESQIREQMKAEAQKEMANMRARGAGTASDILVDMMLQQRHEKAMEDLEKEMKVEMQRSRDQMNEQLHAEMMAALSDEGKNFMAEMAANSGLTNSDLTEAMENAAKSIQANDQTVKKLAKEMKVRVKTAKGERSYGGF
ncbi:trichohyalin-like [Watersipora subatra]|uniref:trichohyalin-like n=1 Tax=Watersipora subatra TaxID=2589382 RepID=UPI00355BE057